MYRILAINLGSTSTKMAYYEDDICISSITENHPTGDIVKFPDIMDQFKYRKESVEKFLKFNGIEKSSLDAIVSRGGNTKPLESGVYRITNEMLIQQASGTYGRHACDLGSKIAYEMCGNSRVIPLVVDPPVTDEFDSIARLSGHPLFPRQSCFHALNHKATAKRYARENGLKYDELNLVVAHLGGGISVAPHKQGRMVDGDNALDGDGAFSTNRTGGLPAGALAKMCFSGEYTYEEVTKMINGEGGLVAYLGTSDVRAIEEKAKTDENAALCLDAMIYQVCKQIGAMSTVLSGDVDAILLTGGIANSKYVVQKIKDNCGFIAPIAVYPGENEMKSLARGALESLRGEEMIKELA
ncbi:butyrate kinase [Bacillus sp. JJ722]|uniref:butyrate kinase n=1 Tax=Bacillus sp. JJ722 TaxID=3122973 RepID=UPI002FFD5A20